jgi:hypothetical protein
MRNLLVVGVIIFFAVACKNKSGKKQDEPVVPTMSAADSALIKQQKDSTLLSLTKDVLTVIKNKNYDSLALFIHPVEGVRFSPNAFVDTSGDKIFTAALFKKEATAKKQQKITWGEYDGSGDPINLTIDEYFKKFVYDVDFLTPENRKVNEFIGGSNSQNNLLAVYDSCDFTESHFSGFDKKFDGMDWRSIRLVFKMKDGKYFLVGIIHDEWTI